MIAGPLHEHKGCLYPMTQAFSLQSFGVPFPRALSWANMSEALGLKIHSLHKSSTSLTKIAAFSTSPTTFSTSPTTFSTSPTTFSTRPTTFSTRPTASLILAQGNALGKPEQRNKQPEGLPHNPAIRLHPGKKQVFSLQRFATHFHKALPWASVHETFAL